MTLYIAPIVEGKTEFICVERLLQRTWTEVLACSERLQVLLPSRAKRSPLIDPNKVLLADKMKEAVTKLRQQIPANSKERGMVLLLLDAERDCPKALAPQLLAAATKARSDADIACVLANWMLENWIVAGASTLAGVNDLPNPLPTRDKFEERSGVAWLEKQMRSRSPSRSYKKTIDANVFVQHMNLTECRVNSPSFDKLCRELEKRLPAAPNASAESTSA